MGADSLIENGITKKLLYIIRDKSLTSRHEPLHKVRKSQIILFVGVQLVGFGATFAITQTIGTLFLSHQFIDALTSETVSAAIGFPVIIMLLLPLRTVIIPKLPFKREELVILDGPTASSFVSCSLTACLGSLLTVSFLFVDHGIRGWNILTPKFLVTCCDANYEPTPIISSPEGVTPSADVH